MKEITVILPPGKEKKLDCSRLNKLISKALYRTLNDLRNLSPPFRLKPICRPVDGSITYKEILSPDYRDKEIWSKIYKIWRTDETIALAKYLWDNGACKKTLTGLNPKREDWESFIFSDLVHHPLLIALEMSTRERLINFDNIESWEIDEVKIDKFINDVVEFNCYHRNHVIAYCPFSRIKIPSGTTIELSSDIKIRGCSTYDICLLLSRYSREYLWDDFKMPALVRGLAEIHVIVRTRIKHDFNEIIQDQLDLAKWALLLASGKELPVSEGTCIITGILDSRVGAFRRDENYGVDYEINESKVERCKELIKDFENASFHNNELKSALWHFGRACVAKQARDIILESAIGLDILLVSGSGDSRYKFCLHGAAILLYNNDDKQAYFDELKIIYGNRSKAAHGRKASKKIDLATIAIMARKRLAEAIGCIINLLACNEIENKPEIAKEVEKYVLKKVTSKSSIGDKNS